MMRQMYTLCTIVYDLTGDGELKQGDYLVTYRRPGGIWEKSSAYRVMSARIVNSRKINRATTIRYRARCLRVPVFDVNGRAWALWWNDRRSKTRRKGQTWKS